MAKQEIFTFQTEGRGTYEITSRINQIVANSGVTTGICNVFVHHTGTSLIIFSYWVDEETIIAKIYKDRNISGLTTQRITQTHLK